MSNGTKTKSPAIPSLRGIDDPNIVRVLEPIIQILNERITGSKAWLDRNSLQGTNGVLADILTNGGKSGGISLDFTTPTKPSGLSAIGAFTNVFLRWNYVSYANHAYTEIWRAQKDDLSQAVRINTAGGNLYADIVPSGTTYYYWIRFVSKAGVIGPYNASSGTKGATDDTPSDVLDTLEGQIDESHLIEALTNDLDALRNEKIIKVNENGYIAGIGIAVEGGVSGDPEGIVVIMTDRFAIVSPNNNPREAPKYPFIIGRVNGRTQVGINGNLAVDGTISGKKIVAASITADLLSVNRLSAIAADLGVVTSGTFRTSGSNQAARVEISDSGAFRVWAGSGQKNSSNATFYIDQSGNAVFKGILAAAGGVFTGTLDGVDGVFTGTVYAENIIGDVIDRLAVTVPPIVRNYGSGLVYEYGNFVIKTPLSKFDYVVETVNISASNFPRVYQSTGFGAVLLKDFIDGVGMGVKFKAKIKLNGTSIWTSSTINLQGYTYPGFKYNFEDNVPIELAANTNHRVEYVVEFSLVWTTQWGVPISNLPLVPSSGYQGLYSRPGNKFIDAYKRESEGISYS